MIIIYVDAIDECVQESADENFVIRITGLEGGKPGEDFFFGETEAHCYAHFGDVGFEFGFLGFQLLYAGIDFFIGDLGRVDQGINKFFLFIVDLCEGFFQLFNAGLGEFFVIFLDNGRRDGFHTRGREDIFHCLMENILFHFFAALVLFMAAVTALS
ncbi:hypothetical protein JRC49_03490 [Clostridiales bacterium FE2011]|nr:hypothetical protein JRC49_03490 [Clostridiales bacterium FE2011]